MKGHWKTLLVAAGVAVMALSVVAVASGATAAPSTQAPAGACTALTDDPQALEEREALRGGFEKARAAWRDKYGADVRTDEARAALQEIRDGYWDDMRSLLEKYGVDVPEGAGPGSRSGQGGGMMGAGNGGGNGQGLGHSGGNGQGTGQCGGMTGTTTI